MRGQETAKKYNHAALGLSGRQWVCIETVAGRGVMYGFLSCDFPTSRREYDWVLKLGPPLG